MISAPAEGLRKAMNMKGISHEIKAPLTSSKENSGFPPKGQLAALQINKAVSASGSLFTLS